MNPSQAVSRRRLRTPSLRIGTLHVVVALVAMASIGAVGLRLGRSHLDQTIEDRVNDRAALVERFAAAGDRLYDPEPTLDLVADSPFVDAVDPLNTATLERFQLTPSSDPLLAVALVRHDGTILASRPDGLSIPAEVLEPVLALAARGEPGLTESFELSGEFAWGRSFPVGDDPWGALVMVEGLEDGWLQRLYEDLGSLGTGEGGLTLVDAAGRAVASWDRGLLGEEVIEPARLASVRTGRTRWTSTVDGEATIHVATTRDGPHGGTILMFHQAEDELTADLRAAQRQRDLGLLVTLGAAAAVLTLFALQRQRAIRRDERRAEVILAASDDLIAVVDRDGTIHSVSSGLERLLGQSPEAWVGRSLLDLVDPPERESVVAAIARVCEVGQAAVLGVSLIGADDEARWFDLTFVDRRDDPRVGGIVATCSEITDRKALEDTLAHEATHDPLTGLANRSRFDQCLEARTPVSDSIVVGVLDLDRFKALNDQLGHDAGDHALRSVAAVLRTHLDVVGVAARLGGDEFAFFVEGCDDDQLDTLCRALISSVEAIWPGGIDGPNLSASIGVARVDARGMTPSMLLREADRAMYEAKAAGGGTWRLATASPLAATAGPVGTPSEPPTPAVGGRVATLDPIALPPRRQRWSHARRRDLVSLLVVIAVIVGFGAVTVALGSRAQRAIEAERVTDRLELLTSLAAIGESTTSPDRLVELAATVPADPAQPEVTHAVLRQWLKSPALGDHASIALVDTRGAILAAEPPDLVLPDELLVAGTHWGDVLAGSPSIPPLLEGSDGRLRFHWVLPVVEDDVVTRVLVLGSSVRDNNWSDVQAQVGSLGPYPGGAFALDSNGVASVAWDPELVGTRVLDPRHLDGLDHGEHLRLRLDDEGREHTALVVRMPDPYSERYMMWTQETAHLFADLRQGERTRNMALTTAASVAILGLAVANRRREQLLQVHNGRLHALLQRSSTIVAIVDGHRRLTFVSSAATGHTGVERRQLEGQTLDRLVGPATAEIGEAIERAVPGTEVRLRAVPIPGADGATRIFDVGVADLTGHPAVRGTLLTLRDRTDRQALEDHLRDQATRDPLTGLPNRTAFARALEAYGPDRATVDGSGTLAVVFIDLDRFKPVNDVHGHQVGDEMLRVVAARIRSAVGDDGLVARHGGDEFTILLPDHDAEQAEVVTERVLAAVRRPVRIGTLELQVGASSGVVVTDGVDSVGRLIRAADLAMYDAKRNGRDRWAIDTLPDAG